ncbi:MAG: hypothetical protein OEV08_16235, partial [Nitrospira sp.]|nr:hypothetical protein [Nitrospira sp.]
MRSPFAESILAIHQRDRFLETIDELPVGGGRKSPVAVPDLLQSLGGACLQDLVVSTALPFVVIHPGSGSAHKCMAPELLSAVVEAFQAMGVTPIILEGPADRESVER